MQLILGDLWEELGRADLILVTTNAQTNRLGQLVMGRGAARQAKEWFPFLDEDFGNQLKARNLVGRRYGLLFAPEAFTTRYPPTRLGAFQVKYHWKDEASLELIRYSVTCLIRWESRYREWLKRDGEERAPRIVLNFPGIGNGRLGRESVLPILADLPNSVFVYELPGEAGVR